MLLSQRQIMRYIFSLETNPSQNKHGFNFHSDSFIMLWSPNVNDIVNDRITTDRRKAHLEEMFSHRQIRRYFALQE